MQTGNTARQKLSVSNKERKFKVLIVKSVYMRNIGPAFLDLELVQESYQLDVWMSGRWKPGGLEDGHQEVWSVLVVCIIDVKRMYM